MTKSFSIIPHPHEPSSILTTLTVTALTVSTAAILHFYFGTSRRTATSHKQKIMSNTTTDFIQYPEGTVTTPLVNRRNQKLHTLHVKNNTSTKSSTKAPPTKIFFVHGVGDHSGRPCYTRLYEFLVQQQQPQQQPYEVFALDLSSHGQSEGDPRCYCDQITDFVHDYMDLIQAHYDPAVDSPIYLIGHSMGGLVASLAAAEFPQDQLQGLILSAPATGVEMDLVMKVQKFFGPLLTCVAPQAQLVNAVRVEDLSRDVQELELYQKDPLIFQGKLRVRVGTELDDGFTLLKTKRSDITCPLLVLHGSADQATEPKASKDFFQHVGSTHKLYVDLQGYYHELFNEPDRDNFMKVMSDFLQVTTSHMGKEEEDGSKFSKFLEGYSVKEDGILQL
jgi:acylglycerol lipase